jgi:4-hydroxy-2-oxoheptanedioate aldolase
MSLSPRDLVRNNVKEKLARDELIVSMIVRLTRSVEIVGIAKTAGMDSVYVDMEHNSFTLDTTGQICMACQAMDVMPLVRVPSLGATSIPSLPPAALMKAVAVLCPSPREPKWTPIQTRPASSSNRST